MEEPGISSGGGSERSSARIVVIGLLLVILAFGWWAQQSISRSRAENLRTLQLTRIQADSMGSRMALDRFLLSGDTREIDKITRLSGEVESKVNQLQTDRAVSPDIADGYRRIRETQEQWTEQFAKPLIKIRQALDEGKGNLADLQIQYLQMDPVAWDRRFEDEFEKLTKPPEEKE